jgi:predicted O-linked N-acetylglucosamine transferase (SPINDLY family)
MLLEDHELNVKGRKAQKTLLRAYTEYNRNNFAGAQSILDELPWLENDNSAVTVLRGILDLANHRLPAALKRLSKAVVAEPENPFRRFYFGLAHENSGNIPEAIKQYEKTLELNPGYVPAINNLSRIYCYSNISKAEDLCGEGLKLFPGSPILHATMGMILSAAGLPDKAIKHFRKSLRLNPSDAEVRSAMIFNMNYLPETTIESLLKEEKILQEKIYGCKKFSRSEDIYSIKPKRGKSKIRLGYISPDLHQHSIAFFFEPLIAAHDKDKFLIYCYSDVEIPDEMTGRIRKHADAWRDISHLSNDKARQLIRNDRIDILIDLFGHTAGRRMELFARRSAPLQISYLGYPGSCGLSNIDFRIGDIYADPPESDGFFPETVLRLPNGFWVYSPPWDSSPPTVKSPFLEKDCFTFGSFNNQSKITPEVIAAWSRILKNNINTRLMLKNNSLNDIRVAERVAAAFEEHGVSAARLALAPFCNSTEEHLAAYNEVDAALDTFPYNGTTTTFEALWMGAPVITLRGRLHSSRTGGAILSRLGLEEFIADSLEAYIDLASSLPDRMKRLINLRPQLRTMLESSPFCKTAQQTREIEQAYLSAYSTNILRKQSLK